MNTPATNPGRGSSQRLFLAVMILAAISTLAVTALLINIFERKQEARNPFYRVVELNDTIDDPAIWGKDFPLQYDLYLRTVDMQRTKYGGSEAMPHSPTQADPRSVVARSKLEQDPRLKIIWAGYAFSADYRERRGHAYMLDDQTFTERQKFNPPAMCINCHASLVTTFLQLGNGDLIKGFNVISDSHMTYSQIRQYVKHPVSCIDCHDPKTMQLRVTEGGAAAPGARLTFRFARPGAAPFYTQAVADSGGAAEIKIEVEEAALPDSSLLVQANFEGRTATRKFVLRRAE